MTAMATGWRVGDGARCAWENGFEILRAGCIEAHDGLACRAR